MLVSSHHAQFSLKETFQVNQHNQYYSRMVQFVSTSAFLLTQLNYCIFLSKFKVKKLPYVCK